MPFVLFVCTANRFRSPIAAAIFRKELALRNIAIDWRVASAGTWTMDGLPAATEAIAGARRLGLDISQHASRTITAQLMRDADLILTMEQGQCEALKSEFPGQSAKVHVLTEAATGSAYNIPDPIEVSTGDEVTGELDELIRSGFDRICSLASTM